MDYDFYEGWVLKKQISNLDEETYKKVSLNDPYFSDEMVTFITDKDQHPQLLTLGAGLPEFNKGVFYLATELYAFDGDVINGKHKKVKSGSYRL